MARRATHPAGRGALACPPGSRRRPDEPAPSGRGRRSAARHAAVQLCRVPSQPADAVALHRRARLTIGRSRVAPVTATPQSLELRALAQEIADALPPGAEEVVVTGSVSRGVADDLSDIEMLIVTPDDLDLDECF